MELIKKSALAVIEKNKLLVVKPHNSSFLLMPGGKPEQGETPVAALKREVMEELGCSIEDSSIAFLGTFEDTAAGSSNMVSIGLYTGKLVGTPKPCSEIEELVWVGANSRDGRISPVIRNKIVPFLVGRKLLS